MLLIQLISVRKPIRHTSESSFSSIGFSSYTRDKD